MLGVVDAVMVSCFSPVLPLRFRRGFHMNRWLSLFRLKNIGKTVLSILKSFSGLLGILVAAPGILLKVPGI